MSRRPEKKIGSGSDAKLVALFLDMLTAERGAGANTLAAYGRDLADFAAHLGKRKGSPDLLTSVRSRVNPRSDAGRSIANASTEDVRAYLGSLAKRGFAAA